MTIKRSKLQIGLLGLVLAFAATASLQPANAVPAPGRGYAVRLDGDWVRFDRHEHRRPADKIETIRGSQTPDGGCRGGTSGRLDQSLNRVVVGVEIAFNPSTCESVYEIRYLTASEVEELRASHKVPRPPDPEPEPAVPAPQGSANTSDPQPAANTLQTKSAAAFTESWYEDPPGWNVTGTRVTTNWSYNGNCVVTAGGTKNRTHRSQTGWGLVSEDWQNTTSCTQSRSALYAKFRDGVFCLGIDTFNTYERAEVLGEENGTASFYWPASKSGGCTNLLSHRHLTGFL